MITFAASELALACADGLAWPALDSLIRLQHATHAGRGKNASRPHAATPGVG